MGNHASVIADAPGSVGDQIAAAQGTKKKQDRDSMRQRSIRFVDDDDDIRNVGNSTRSTGESSLASSTHSTGRAPSLRQNMMRERKDCDPLLHYEVVEVMGVGSMGCVSKVKKRESAVGGSARMSNSERGRIESEQKKKHCFGGLFHACLRGVSLDSNSTRKHLLSSDSSIDSGETRSLTESSRHASSSSGSFYIKKSAKYSVFYALKSIHLDRVTDQTFVLELKNEIEILKSLDHPHIVRPIETYEYNRQLFMVLELCNGGDLYSRDPYTEEQAARITNSILSAVAFMHLNNIIHRDLKYENIMFANPSARSEIKIIDYGLSRKYGPDPMHEGVGTIYTMAPQVLEGTYTAKADIWSVGVLAYMLLSSQMPFYGRKRRQVVEKIMAGKYDFKGRRWKTISNQAKEFVQDLLQLDPDDRPDAEDALGALWLSKGQAASVRTPNEAVLDNIQATLQNYVGYSQLKKLALMVIAHKSTSEEIGILRKAFQRYDLKRNGTISREEFKQALSVYGYSDEDLDRIFQGVDLDGTGQIRYTEFLGATIEATGPISEERIAEAFDRIDSDDSGYISVENLSELFGGDIPKTDLQAIIDEADLTHNNKISYEEFLALWNEDQEEAREKVFREISWKRSESQMSGYGSDSLREGDSLRGLSVLEEENLLRKSMFPQKGENLVELLAPQ